MAFTCGTCKGSHHYAATGRACAEGRVSAACAWAVEQWTEAAYEDGQAAIVDCGASVVFAADGTSWECEAGHGYVSMETRHTQGWDYAEDDEEAAAMARAGVEPVVMGPGADISWVA